MKWNTNNGIHKNSLTKAVDQQKVELTDRI